MAKAELFPLAGWAGPSQGQTAAAVEVLSLHLGPQEILVGVTIDFRDDLPGGALENAADELSDRIQQAQPCITRLFLRPGAQASVKTAHVPN